MATRNRSAVCLPVIRCLPRPTAGDAKLRPEECTCRSLRKSDNRVRTNQEQLVCKLTLEQRIMPLLWCGKDSTGIRRGKRRKSRAFIDRSVRAPIR